MHQCAASVSQLDTLLVKHANVMQTHHPHCVLTARCPWPVRPKLSTQYCDKYVIYMLRQLVVVLAGNSQGCCALEFL